MREAGFEWWVLNDHLCLNEISCVTVFIDATSVEPGAGHFEASAGYDHQVDVFANELVLKALNVPLDNVSRPLAGDVLEEKVFQDVIVPHITSVDLCVDVLLSVLQRRGQVECWWKVKARSQQPLNTGYERCNILGHLGILGKMGEKFYLRYFKYISVLNFGNELLISDQDQVVQAFNVDDAQYAVKLDAITCHVCFIEWFLENAAKWTFFNR